MVHCHDARNLHWDLRIQVGGVLQSFAVPKGPSLDPSQKRLAVHTEPHPLGYLTFEGVIPEGNYGAGAMIVWDTGRVLYPKQTAEEGLTEGALSIELSGFKLKGRFSLVRPKKQTGKEKNQWLLIKREDAHVSDVDIIEQSPRSVLSGLTVEELPRLDELKAETEKTAKRLGAEPGELHAGRVTPMLCALEGAPVTAPDWLYELKLDGVRILAERSGPDARLFYRTHRSATAVFPEILAALKALPVDRAILDGEIVTFDDRGLPSFQRLAQRLHARKATEIAFMRDAIPVVYAVFDILSLGDYDTRKLPLSERKQLLQEVVRGKGVIRVLEHLEERGDMLLQFAEDHDLEGIVAKRSNSKYEEGPQRSGAWVKIKREREEDFVVFGYTSGTGARKRLGALDVGSYADGELVTRGKVGSGLSDKEIDRLLSRFEEQEASGAAGELETAKGRVFVKPDTVVRVRYGGWTDQGRLRFPVYLGIRDDIDPKSTDAAPKPEDATMLATTTAATEGDTRTAGKVKLTNQGKLYWPEDGITKGDLCSYYEEVAPVMLPHLRDRPVTLVRYPDGIGQKSFFQWRIPKHAPPWLQSLELRSTQTDGKQVNTILIDGPDALLYVANLGCIELHIVAARAGALDHCDFLTVDFDVEFSSLREAIQIAFSLRELLAEVGLSGYPKTSGKTGLHVLIPLGSGIPFDPAKQLLELLGRLLVQRHPKTATMERRKEKRGKKVFIDVGQTGPSRTIVAPYSVRAASGAPVSTPLLWDELSLALDPRAFTIFTVPQRVLEHGDPLVDAWKNDIDVAQMMTKLQAALQS